MNTHTPALENKKFTAWADAERAFEDFIHTQSMGEVRQMSDAAFIAWLVAYRAVYDALWNAQVAYYAACRS